MTGRLARLDLSRGWRVPYPAQVALLVAVGLALLAATQFFATANRAEAEAGAAKLFAAIAIIVAFSRFAGAIAQRLGQPRVMGEIIAGILLGKTLIGSLPAVVPGLCPAPVDLTTCSWPFPGSTVDALRAAAEIGLVFYMFLVGLELDPVVIRQRARQAAAISLTSVALPFSLGIIAALILLGSTAPGVANPYGDEGRPLAFIVFMGVAMSITAFPVLARILVERRMIRGPIGGLVLACAAIDDVVAWSMLALATVFATVGVMMPESGQAILPPPNPVAILILAIAFVLVMALLVRPVIARAAVAYDESGSLSGAWIVLIFIGILVAAFAAQQSGIAVIFGAFIFGLMMPRRSGLTEAITSRVEDFVVIVLLPLFFVISGLKVDLLSHVSDPVFWFWTLVLIAIAIGGKWIGATAAARVVGIDRRSSMAVGALMNTRGLTELIVLNVGLSLGVITQELFTMLVVMAVVTTLIAGPALRLIDRRGTLSVSPEKEVANAAAEPVTAGAILVACQDSKNLESLVAFARSLTTDRELGREIILVRLLELSPTAARWSRDRAALSRASEELSTQVEALAQAGIKARAVPLISANLRTDLSRLAGDDVDLVLSDGRRSLATDGLPGGAVGTLLNEAACDVAVLVERGRRMTIDAEHPVVVPFGGSDHDWAAVEIAARLADANKAHLRLVGVLQATATHDTTEVLEAAAVAVQSISGVVAEPVYVEAGGQHMLDAAQDAGLLVVGLSRRWREEGLGSVRRQIAAEADAPLLFVRRGSRSAMIAPSGSIGEFGWSMSG